MRLGELQERFDGPVDETVWTSWLVTVDSGVLRIPDEPNDPGGYTNYGYIQTAQEVELRGQTVTLKFADSWPDVSQFWIDFLGGTPYQTFGVRNGFWYQGADWAWGDAAHDASLTSGPLPPEHVWLRVVIGDGGVAAYESSADGENWSFLCWSQKPLGESGVFSVTGYDTSILRLDGINVPPPPPPPPPPEPSAFVLTLDTTAPEVIWGEPVNTTAGERLGVAVSLDEGTLVEGWLLLADRQRLEAELLDGAMAVQLPGDMPTGLGVLNARVRDDVGNEAIRTQTVYLVGTYSPLPAAPPAPAPTGTPRSRRVEEPPRRREPPTPRTPERRRIETTSHVGPASTTRVVARRTAASSVGPTSGSRARHRVVVASTARAAGGQRIASRHESHAAVGATSTTEVRRRDGPTIIALLADIL